MPATSPDFARSFGAQAAAYDRGRPEYPDEAIAWLLGDAARVADVGAGTGKLTRVVARLGHDVVAIEPDAAMRAQLAAALPGVEALDGTGEALPLADASVDAVTYGQAWHWVDPDAGSREAGRVLRAGGVLGLVWNVRDEAVDWVAELTRVMGESAGEAMVAAGRPPFGPPFAHATERRFTWTRTLTRAGLLDLVTSRSPIINATPDDRAAIMAGVEQLLDGHPALAGRASFELPYVTSAWRLVR